MFQTTRIWRIAIILISFASGTWAQGDKATTVTRHRGVYRTQKLTTGTARGQFPSNPDSYFTSRPLLAVGTLKQIDSASSTVLVAIDRKLSSIPSVLTLNAQQGGVAQAIIDREFPPERIFKIHRRTYLRDARPLAKRDQPAEQIRQKLPHQRDRIGFGDFKPGERVGVLYRIRPGQPDDPIMLSFSKLDPDQMDFSVDFNPLRNRRGERPQPPKSLADPPTTTTQPQVKDVN
jgi:hypothetical protein